MSDFFKRDKVSTGLVVVLGSEGAVALLLWLGLAVAGIGYAGHLRWFGACFIPPVLFLRHYAKKRDCPTVTKTIIIALFVTFVFFMMMV